MSHSLKHQTNPRRSINRGSFTKHSITTTSQWGSAIVERGNGIRWEETNVIMTFPQRHASTVFTTASWLCSHFRFSFHIFQENCVNASLKEVWPLVSRRAALVPRCKHLLVMLIFSRNSSWTPSPHLPSTLSHRQVQVDCRAKPRLPPSLYLLVFPSVCLKNQG